MNDKTFWCWKYRKETTKKFNDCPKCSIADCHVKRLMELERGIKHLERMIEEANEDVLGDL